MNNRGAYNVDNVMFVLGCVNVNEQIPTATRLLNLFSFCFEEVSKYPASNEAQTTLKEEILAQLRDLKTVLEGRIALIQSGLTLLFQ